MMLCTHTSTLIGEKIIKLFKFLRHTYLFFVVIVILVKNKKGLHLKSVYDLSNFFPE